MKRNISLPISLIVLGLLIIQSLSSLSTASDARARRASPSDAPVSLTWQPMRSDGDAPGDPVIHKADEGEPSRVMVAPMATFTVTTTLDRGTGSLREAIMAANRNPGPDTINFNIGAGGVQTIRPGLSPFPFITDPLTIDGTTQPGFSGTPIIELDGSFAIGENGLTQRGVCEEDEVHRFR